MQYFINHTNHEQAIPQSVISYSCNSAMKVEYCINPVGEDFKLDYLFIDKS